MAAKREPVVVLGPECDDLDSQSMADDARYDAGEALAVVVSLVEQGRLSLVRGVNWW